jgi:hypothetical protein
MLWFEQRSEWWRWLIPSWHVLVESAKDPILGVDTLEQQVPPRIRYGMACLLIRDAMRSVPCSDEWEVAWLFAQAHMVQKGPWYHDYSENVSIPVVPRITLVEPSIRPIVDLCNSM